jgi:hypothetical protein
MPLRADITAITHSAADKATSAAGCRDLDSMKADALTSLDDFNRALNEYKKALPVGHTGIAAIATTLTSHL